MNKCILVKIVTYLKCDLPLKVFKLTIPEDEMLSCVVPEFSWKNVLFDEKPYFYTIWDAVRYAIHLKPWMKHGIRSESKSHRNKLLIYKIQLPSKMNCSFLNIIRANHRCRSEFRSNATHFLTSNILEYEYYCFVIL